MLNQHCRVAETTTLCRWPFFLFRRQFPLFLFTLGKANKWETAQGRERKRKLVKKKKDVYVGIYHEDSNVVALPPLVLVHF